MTELDSIIYDFRARMAHCFDLIDMIEEAVIDIRRNEFWQQDDEGGPA